MNISKIAELSGVSRATVSRYLNNGYVSDEKKERIKRVIKDTGYRPSMQAQTLRTKKTKLIGVIIPKISSESISKIVDGISKKLYEYGYNIFLGNTDNNTDKEIEFLNIFKNNYVDGVIFIATIFKKAHEDILKSMSVPIVILGQKSEKYCCVYHDDFGAAKELTECLLNSGCKNIAYIGVTEKDKAAGLERKNGFLHALENKEIKCDNIRIGEFKYASGYELMKDILNRCNLIDGVFCATDTIAVGAMDAIKEKNMKIPDDIKVVGIGDSIFSKVVTPRLTTAKYYYTKSGTEAASMLLTMMDENKMYTKRLKLGYEIMIRESI